MGQELSFVSGFASTPSGANALVDAGKTAIRTVTKKNSNNQHNSSSTQANIESSDSSNDQPQSNRIKPSDTSDSSNQDQAASPTVRDAAKENSLNIQHKRKKIRKSNVDATKYKKKTMDTIPENENESDNDVRTAQEVQEAKNKNSPSINETPSENQTELVVLEKRIEQQPKPIPELKSSLQTSSNALTSKHVNEDPCAPDIKNAVMIYDTIDEAIKTNVESYTKSFAQTKKKRKLFKDIGITKAIGDFTKEVIRQSKNKNSEYSKYLQSIKDKWNINRKNANEKRKQDKKKLQESKDQAETDANNLVDELLDIDIDIDEIEPNHPLIIKLHIKIQQVEGGAKAYIAKLENAAMNMKGGKRGKRTRRKRQPVQKGGNTDSEKTKKLKIVNILKQLNSANYIDYEIETIIQELKRLLGKPSTVDTSIPEKITTKTTIQEDMYSEPLSVCKEYDENVDNDPKCKDNRKALKNRLKYFNKLKELNAMHNDNALVIFAENTFKDNIKTITAYYEPYAKSNDTTTEKADKDKQYLATLEDFKPINKQDSTLEKKITKYNEIVKYLNENKEHIVNPQLDEKLMTTNTKQTVTQSSSLKNILGVEHLLNIIGKFNMDEYQSTYGNVNNMGDPGHTNTSDITVVNSTDILRKPENNVEAK